jgi:hypothetical protein
MRRATYNNSSRLTLPQVFSIGNAIAMLIAAYMGDMGQLKPLNSHGIPPLDKSFQIFNQVYSTTLRDSSTRLANAYIRRQSTPTNC